MKKTRQGNFRIIPPPDRLFTLRKCPFCGKRPALMEVNGMGNGVKGYTISCVADDHCAKVVGTQPMVDIS